MKEIGRYDSSLQMFVEKPKALNSGVLMMWRIRAENGTAGRKPEGRPAGDIALAMVIQANQPIEKIMDQRMRQHLAAGEDLRKHIANDGSY